MLNKGKTKTKVINKTKKPNSSTKKFASANFLVKQYQLKKRGEQHDRSKENNRN